MTSITYDRFDGGLDVRRGASTSDANRLRVLRNAYITTGKQVQKRPCLSRVATLEPGTKGLRAAAGKLNTFYESGAIVHANTLFKANKCPHPTTPQLVSRVHFADMFLGYLYASVEYVDGSVWHHYLDGTPASHIADANCPQSKGVVKATNKIYAINGETVRFCAAGAARDWTTPSDAGFLPVGRYQTGSSECLALGTFQRQLASFFIDGTQLWNIDEDPANNSLNKQVFGVGTQYPASPASFATDVFFLSDIGFRSITVSTTIQDNFQDVDIGSPIDALVTPDLPTSSNVAAGYVPGFGQYWCFIGDTAWVYTFSRVAKISCWSEYVFPVTVDAHAALNNRLYVRSGDEVFEVTRGVFTDNGEPVPVTVQLPYVDAKDPGNLKQFWGADFVGVGTPSMSFAYDQNDTGKQTAAYEYTGDTRTGTLHPVDVAAVNISPIITHEADEDFRLDAMTLYFHSLGAV